MTNGGFSSVGVRAEDKHEEYERERIEHEEDERLERYIKQFVFAAGGAAALITLVALGVVAAAWALK